MMGMRAELHAPDTLGIVGYIRRLTASKSVGQIGRRGSGRRISRRHKEAPPPGAFLTEGHHV
jgi:hypothetical protein